MSKRSLKPSRLSKKPSLSNQSFAQTFCSKSKKHPSRICHGCRLCTPASSSTSMPSSSTYIWKKGNRKDIEESGYCTQSEYEDRAHSSKYSSTIYIDPTLNRSTTEKPSVTNHSRSSSQKSKSRSFSSDEPLRYSDGTHESSTIPMVSRKRKGKVSIHSLKNVIKRKTQSSSVVPSRPYDRSRVVNMDSKTLSEWKKRLLGLINESRAAVNVQPVAMNELLERAAILHTEDQAARAKRCTHDGSDGTRPSQRVLREGYDYQYTGENVARGQTSPEHVHSSFMKSEGHRKTVLNEIYTEVGLHVCRSLDGDYYWTEEFGRKMVRRKR